MVDFKLSVADLADASFSYSPLQEAAGSLRVRYFASAYPEHLPFRRATEAAYAGLDVEMLAALVSPRRWTPDFLTPRPSGAVRTFAAELEILRATPPATVTQHLSDAYADDPLPPVLRTPPHALLDRIVTAMTAYWATCVEPWWPRIGALLEADVIHRARGLAAGGAGALFEDLGPNVRWRAGVLSLEFPFWTPWDSTEVAGRGLVLSPSCFLRRAVSSVSEDEPPLIAYPARGRATVWESAPSPAPAALANVLGETRARLLTELAAPATTAELARRFGVTPSAISQHLTALHAVRLVNRSRSGRSVLYFRSSLGDALCG